LHDQKSGFFGGPDFIQPIKQFEKFSKTSDWLEKSRFCFDHVNRLLMTGDAATTLPLLYPA